MASSSKLLSLELLVGSSGVSPRHARLVVVMAMHGRDAQNYW
jgi:hypothetical protein